MPKREDMDRYDRPSWSEIDKRRDRSRHRSEEKQREPRSEQDRAISKSAKEAYLKKLDQKLFGGKKRRLDEAETAVREVRGTRGFSDACDAYIEKKGFPASGELLLLFLDHETPEIVLRTIDALIVHAREKSVDRDALGKALRRVKVMTEDADVEGAAEELLEDI